MKKRYFVHGVGYYFVEEDSIERELLMIEKAGNYELGNAIRFLSKDGERFPLPSKFVIEALNQRVVKQVELFDGQKDKSGTEYCLIVLVDIPDYSKVKP